MASARWTCHSSAADDLDPCHQSRLGMAGIDRLRKLVLCLLIQAKRKTKSGKGHGESRRACYNAVSAVVVRRDRESKRLHVLLVSMIRSLSMHGGVWLDFCLIAQIASNVLVGIIDRRHALRSPRTALIYQRVLIGRLENHVVRNILNTVLGCRSQSRK